MEEELLLVSIIAVCAQKLKKERRSVRRSRWSREWLLKRGTFSHVNLLRELQHEPEDWRNYLRMDIDTYCKLLTLVTPEIEKQDTAMRAAISPHERLTATLRFLATGRSYKDLEYTTIISKQALSRIIPETCEAIYNVLKKEYFKFPTTEKEWTDIAEEFNTKWQFPHCLGAVDGKHVRIIPPAHSGSYYFNYKSTHSIVLMAIANANCEFIYCDVGTNGRVSDGGVIANTAFYDKLTQGMLEIPKAKKVSNSNQVLPYVFVGDEAFGLRPDFLKPYPRSSLNRDLRIFNYRLSRARRVIENTFGIMASRFRILQTAINLDVNNVDIVVMTCCVLHNFLRKLCSQNYSSPDVLDAENIEDGSVVLGARCNPEIMHNLQLGRRGLILESARVVRDKFKIYFNNEGSVPWQDKAIT